MKIKNHLIISMNATKEFGRLLPDFMIKLLNKLDIKSTYFKIAMAVCDKSTASIILKQNQDGTRKRYPVSPP